MIGRVKMTGVAMNSFAEGDAGFVLNQSFYIKERNLEQFLCN